jgi:hypothetical protein
MQLEVEQLEAAGGGAARGGAAGGEVSGAKCERGAALVPRAAPLGSAGGGCWQSPKNGFIEANGFTSPPLPGC